MAVLRRASRGAAGGPDGTDVASVCVLPASTDRAQPNALASRTGLDNAANSAAAGECGVRRERGTGACTKRETRPK